MRILLLFSILILTVLGPSNTKKKCTAPFGSPPFSGLYARVLGAGVIGLSNAIMLQRAGFTVTVHAKDGPCDYDPVHSDPWYASPRSGAWIPGEGPEIYWEATYDTFVAFHRTYPLAGVGLYETHDYFAIPLTEEEFLDDTAHTYGKQFHRLSEAFLNNLTYPNGTRMFSAGASWLTPIAAPLQYLKTLMDIFLQQGGIYRREYVYSISYLTNMHYTDLVVISPGLGARSLGDLLDLSVVPIKGQLVIMKQPDDDDVSKQVTIARWVDFWPEYTYILPHPDGEILLGGTYGFNDSSTNVDLVVKAGILHRTGLLEPKLKGLTFLRDQVAWRPGRVEEERIEVEPNKNKFKVPVIYAYGHGGEGFEGSWGTALKVLALAGTIPLCS